MTLSLYSYNALSNLMSNREVSKTEAKLKNKFFKFYFPFNKFFIQLGNAQTNFSNIVEPL